MPGGRRPPLRGGKRKPGKRKAKSYAPRPAFKDIQGLDYKDVNLLHRYLSPQGKILSRKRTRTSATSQRELKRHIKYARYLALLPYVAD
ncbi:MAG: 30S ribosomal protein S18 [Planctomycetes bacterium]|nr:30S ribosomal protein S18 [Planctomycetota bacterium]